MNDKKYDGKAGDYDYKDAGKDESAPYIGFTGRIYNLYKNGEFFKTINSSELKKLKEIKNENMSKTGFTHKKKSGSALDKAKEKSKSRKKPVIKKEKETELEKGETYFDSQEGDIKEYVGKDESGRSKFKQKDGSIRIRPTSKMTKRKEEPKRVENFRAFQVFYLGATNSMGSRVKINDLRFSVSKTISYSYEFNSTYEIAEDFLRKKGINLIGRAEAKDSYLIFSDNFEIQINK